MSDIAEVKTHAFSEAERETLLAWSAKRARGFRVLLTSQNDAVEEVAEFAQRETHNCIYMMHLTEFGRVRLRMVEGWDTWEVDTVEEALAMLLVNEEALEEDWIANTR